MVFQYFFGVGAGLTLGFVIVALPSWLVWQRLKDRSNKDRANWKFARKAGA